MHKLLCSLLAVALSINVAKADVPRPFSHPDRIHYDGHCLTIDGKYTFIYSGAFHYFRCPKELWPERFQKIKDAGFNCVETYAAWNWSEREMPASLDDFSKVDVSDLDAWLAMAEQYGFYVIVRPGPYICAEWDGGGYPQWLVALKKPDQPLRPGAWLRTDDPVYLAWCKHWYDAVCPVIAKHQITRKAPGQPGVILFQIENEYDFAKLSLPDEVRINQLTALANDAAANGIDVPLITCWTKQIRTIKDGILRGVFDCTNFYPRWNVAKELTSKLEHLRTQQPDAPMMTTEMQGGWFAQVGGKLSDQQDGVTAAQIQNLTLYAIQNGETAMSYYMIFGGTNLDDWAAHNLITSYDYNAPIRESGGVGDRYERVWALGHMLIDHAAKLCRADAVPIVATATDADVGIAERRAPDGSRYIFVRTENHLAPRKGTIHLKETNGTAPDLTFDYELEPFGSMVLYLPPGETDPTKGEWLPKPAPPITRPAEGLPSPIAITQVERAPDPLPTNWTHLDPGQKVESLGVFNRHFIYYRLTAQPGETATIEKNTKDTVIAIANGKLLDTGGAGSGKATFALPTDTTVKHVTAPTDTMTIALPAETGETVLLYENSGQPNGGPAMELLNGIRSVKIGGSAVPLEFSAGERDRGLAFSATTAPPEIASWGKVDIAKEAVPTATDLLTWYRAEFALPEKNPAVWVPWQLHIEATGNGFVYLNGHALGRYWQVGPQHDFYLPECWLNFGADQKNAVAFDLRPDGKGVSVQALSIAPETALAEKR